MNALNKRELLLTTLRFLARSAEKKAEYLSVVPAENSVFPGEGEEAFVTPCHAFAVIATDILEKYLAAWPPGKAGEWETVRDMLCVLLMMGDLSAQEYFWFLDKKSHPTSGPHDGAWRVLARLAKIALVQFDSSEEGPMIDFREILRSVEFVVGAKSNSDSEG
jgi:hypothetical protein